MSYVICSYLIIFTTHGRVTNYSITWTVGREFIEFPQAEQTRGINLLALELFFLNFSTLCI